MNFRLNPAVALLVFLLHFTDIRSQDKQLDSLNSLLRVTHHDTAKSSVLLAIGKHLQHQLPDSAMAYFNKAAALAGDDLKKGQVLKLIGEVHYDKGDYPAAIRVYEEVRSITERPEYSASRQAKMLRASVIGNLGLVNMDKGDIAKAIEIYFQALKLYEQLGSKQGQAVNHGNIGIGYAMMGDLDKALEFFNKAYLVNESLGFKSAQVDNLTNMGTVYKMQGKFDKSLEMLYRGYTIDSTQGNKIGQATILGNIATVYSDQAAKLSDRAARRRALENAVACHYRALRLNEEVGRKKGQVINLLNISHIHLAERDFSSAENVLNQAEAIARDMKSLELSMEVHNGLSRLFEQTGNTAGALKEYKLYVQFRDSIFNAENSRKAIQQEYKFNYEKKAATDSIIALEERKLTAEKLEKEKTQRFALYGGLGVLVVFTGFMYNRFKVTSRQKKVIELKERETQSQNEIITLQKHMVEEKQKEILDSIGYAKRIQNTLLAHHEFLREQMPDHFVLFMPKDIVSGDFYWAIEKNGRFYLAVCDSTGHGVPGAFMSLLNISFLNEAINEKSIGPPNEVFDFVRQRLIDNISRDGQKDGFDGILVCFDRNNNTVSYSAANNAPVVIRNNTIIQPEADRMPVGIGERTSPFTCYTLDLEKGDMLYLYTDGYADQFGGPKGKKFKYKPLNELLMTLHAEECETQQAELRRTLIGWKGDLEQVDDICLIGIRI